ncbi:MAG: hypothetical protein LAT57_03540 [Balneolales bacterium]|nr:hypothetical protein [Balneolales bacterium]
MDRRTFIKNTAAASSLLFLPAALSGCAKKTLLSDHGRITGLAVRLLEGWCKGMVAHQTITPDNRITHGGLYSPGDDAYLGRSADGIFPLLWMAIHTGDHSYVESAKLLYEWEQNNCWDDELGCWFNNPNMPNSWKGITVFAAMTKYEAITYFPELLGEETVNEWKARLYRASEYLYDTLTINFGNINYPAFGTLAFYSLGKLFNEPRYIKRAEDLAEGLFPYFLEDGLFFGEGTRVSNEFGQYPVDLGYNVEESLPALAYYARLSGNRELYDKVLFSKKMHLEFMLPNGGWDNSWGTRNFKWTLWGSRTSDGCHPGYYLMANHEPVFAEAVYRNLKCLEDSTYNYLLHSGPHEFVEGILPSMHHTFNHAKALVNLLLVEEPDLLYTDRILPREKEYGVKRFNSIDTLMFSKGSWRGTVTAYAMNYRASGTINGHASGGALTMLYHMRHDIISASSMIEYQRWEQFNMLDEDMVEHFMDLTPLLELRLDDGRIFRNICDHRAKLSYAENGDELIISVKSRLVDGNQIAPDEGSPEVSISYKIKDDVFTIEVSMDGQAAGGKLQFFYPVVCSGNDHVTVEGHRFERSTAIGNVKVTSSQTIETILPENKRVYNFVPGLQAFPLVFDGTDLHRKKLLLQFTV